MKSIVQTGATLMAQVLFCALAFTMHAYPVVAAPENSKADLTEELLILQELERELEQDFKNMMDEFNSIQKRRQTLGRQKLDKSLEKQEILEESAALTEQINQLGSLLHAFEAKVNNAVDQASATAEKATSDADKIFSVVHHCAFLQMQARFQFIKEDPELIWEAIKESLERTANLLALLGDSHQVGHAIYIDGLMMTNTLFGEFLDAKLPADLQETVLEPIADIHQPEDADLTNAINALIGMYALHDSDRPRELLEHQLLVHRHLEDEEPALVGNFHAGLGASLESPDARSESHNMTSEEHFQKASTIFLSMKPRDPMLLAPLYFNWMRLHAKAGRLDQASHIQKRGQAQFDLIPTPATRDNEVANKVIERRRLQFEQASINLEIHILADELYSIEELEIHVPTTPVSDQEGSDPLTRSALAVAWLANQAGEESSLSTRNRLAALARKLATKAEEERKELAIQLIRLATEIESSTIAHRGHTRKDR